jgi:hypothetical protein
MREDDLLRIQHIGDVIDILQTTTHHLYDPDELLTVNLPSSLLFSYSFSFAGIRNPLYYCTNKFGIGSDTLLTSLCKCLVIVVKSFDNEKKEDRLLGRPQWNKICNSDILYNFFLS